MNYKSLHFPSHAFQFSFYNCNQQIYTVVIRININISNTSTYCSNLTV